MYMCLHVTGECITCSTHYGTYIFICGHTLILICIYIIQSTVLSLHTHFCCHFFSGEKKIIETWSYNFFVTTRVKINVGKEACKEWLKSFACNTSCQRARVYYIHVT